MGTTNMIATAKSLALVALAVVATTATGVAQELQTGPDPIAVGRSLPDADREELHPGDPLRLIGVDEGDNVLLEDTYALKRSESQPVLVDLDDQRARQLALLEGETFDRPARGRKMSARERISAHRRARHLRAPGLDEAPEDEDEGTPTWVGLVLALGSMGAVLGMRGRLMV